MSNDDALAAAVGGVEDPVLFHHLSELGILRSVRADNSQLVVHIDEPLADYPAREELSRRISAAVAGHTSLSVQLELGVLDDDGIAALAKSLHELDGPVPLVDAPGGGVRPNPFSARSTATRVLAIASGKGGVGKSTVTVNLAVALAAAGKSVGLLDADVYGFSVPRMLGVSYPPVLVDKIIVPPVAYGVRCASMGLFIEEEKPVAWRGPMLHKALEQFLVDVHWANPDFLLVDMPPGTGDVALSVAEQLPTSELYVVTTPQPAAQRVAQRSGALARQLRLALRGVIENMSYFLAPDGSSLELFGSGGGAMLAESFKVPLLAQIPLDQAVRQGADDGFPAIAVDPHGAVANEFASLAKKIIDAGPARHYRRELSLS